MTTAEDLGRVHLIGVGGVGMNGLARLLATRGIPVSGSELKDWPVLAELRSVGVTIHGQHSVENLDGVDTVVYSTAIPADHVELATARARGLRVLHRAEALAVAMSGRRVIAVAGTHGKTTTTAMITHILQRCGLDPSYVIGGEISSGGASAAHGTGDLFVVEADESDRSFLLYDPQVAVITNIDADHLNTYGDLAGLREAFVEFGGRVPADGVVVTCADDVGGHWLADRLRKDGVKVATYGADADLALNEIRSSAEGVHYSARWNDIDLGEISVPVPGRHLALNSAAALIAVIRAGVKPTDAIAALADFPGVDRRFELKGEAAGVRVYDEYAYHPTSMDAALRTLRELTEGRLVVAFQPYRVYRTRDFRTEIAAALALADEAVVLEVFGPGETLAPGDGGAALVDAIALSEAHKIFVEQWADVAPEVARRTRPGDVVVTMGAPPSSLLGVEVLAALAAAQPADST